MLPQEIVDSFAPDRSEVDRIALRALLEKIEDAGGDDMLGQARQLIVDSTTADAFVQVSLSAQDPHRRAAVIDLLRRENHRAPVLGLAAASADDRESLLDVASSLTDPADRTSFCVLVASPQLHILALDRSYDSESVDLLSVALRQHRYHPDAMAGIADLLQSHGAREYAPVLQMLASGAFLGDAQASKMFWALWAGERGHLVALCAATNVDNVGGAAVVLRRSDAETIIRQMAQQSSGGRTEGELWLLGALDRHGDHAAEERFWNLWSNEPSFPSLFPFPVGDYSYTSVAAMLHRPNYQEIVRQFTDSQQRAHDRGEVWWAASDPELARNPELVERFWTLWAGEKTQRALLNLCFDAAYGGLLSDSPLRRGMVNLLRLPEYADLVARFADAPASRDARAGALRVLGFEQVGGDADLARWVCRTMERDHSLVAVLPSALMPVDGRSADRSTGLARVVAGHGYNELRRAGEPASALPSMALNSNDCGGWVALCRITNSLADLGEVAPSVAKAVDGANDVERPRVEEMLMSALARETPQAVERILIGLGAINDPEVLYQVAKAMAIAQEARMLADRIPNFHVADPHEAQRTPTSLRLQVARAALKSVADAGDVLIAGLARQVPQEDALGHVASVVAAANRLRLDDGGQLIYNALHEADRGGVAPAMSGSAQHRLLLTPAIEPARPSSRPSADGHELAARHQKEITDVVNAFAATVRNGLESALSRQDPESADRIMDAIGQIGDRAQQSRIIHAIAIAQEARSISQNGADSRVSGSPQMLALRVALNGIAHDGDRLAVELASGGDRALEQANAIIDAAYGTSGGDSAASSFSTIRDSERVPSASFVLRDQFQHLQRAKRAPDARKSASHMYRMVGQNDAERQQFSMS